MRFFAFVFSIYVLAIASWPCGDNSDSETDHYEIGHHHDHSDDEDTHDLCSPFCSCQCCQVHMQMPTTFFSQYIAESYSEFYSIYSDQIPDSPHPSLFIPPRA